MIWEVYNFSGLYESVYKQFHVELEEVIFNN